ncbi:MAG: GspH/FimT family pseudopilin [Gammaproteobacteria bacterium]
MRRDQGFTIMELLIVLIIIVLGFAVVGLNMAGGRETIEIKGAAKDVVSALRYVRGQALIRHRPAALTLDLEKNSYTVSGREKAYLIPESIAVTLVTAQSELSGSGQGSIRFFPDGSSTGGRITLERAKTGWQIDINSLTGQAELENVEVH